MPTDHPTPAKGWLERARKIHWPGTMLMREFCLADLPGNVQEAVARELEAVDREARADEDACRYLVDLQHSRTVIADKEWQQATGQHEVLPDLGALIDWLRENRDRLRAENAALKADRAAMVERIAGALCAVVVLKGRSGATMLVEGLGMDKPVWTSDAECSLAFVHRKIRAIVESAAKEKP